MNDTPAPTPLTTQALSRLRKLAEGNGLAPEKVELTEGIEKVYTIEGVSQLTPFCETHTAEYPGPPRGKERSIIDGGPAALQQAALRHQKDFYTKRDWLPAAMEELKAAPGEGWGLDGAKIALHKNSAILATTDSCPGCQGRKVFTCTQCNGQGTVVCSHCQGRGQEICFTCNGRGDDSARPGQPCPTCLGRRYIPCRFCRSSGKLTCPTCLGRRGTTCPQCGGTGVMTHETALACGAKIQFSIKGDSWPSGMRRGLERLGVVNLPKGHADVSRLAEEIPKDEDEDINSGEKPEARAAKPIPMAIVRYKAELPYADIKLRFGGGRVALIAVFGKRGMMMGVPPFLDDALKPWRDKLKQAAAGKYALEKLFDVRAMRDAFTLAIGGKGKVDDLRKLYPLGISPRVMQEIMQDMRRALDQFTFHVRLAAAVGGGALGSALLAGFLLVPPHAAMTQALPWAVGLGIDLVALAAVMAGSWFALGKSVQLKLKRRFPDLKISLHKNAGLIGPSMLGGIAAAWMITLALMPVKSAWVAHIFWFFGR